MLSKILRKAPLEDAPLIIDNAYAVPFYGDDQLPADLVEELQFENPDAAPDEIEDALQEVMDQLRDPGSSEFGAQSSEFGVAGPESEALDPFEAEADAPFESPFGPVGDSDNSQPRTQNAELTRDSELTQNAELLVDDARREAQQVLTQADERAAQIERAAYDQGYGEGVEAGKAGGEQQAAELVQQILAIVDQATELHDTMLREAEAEVVALSLEVARKIIQSELRTNPDVVKSVVSAAVRKINGSPRVTIKVNPSQVAAVRAHWQEAFGADYREKEWIVEADVNVGPGGCVLDTKYGSLDARIGTQFAEVQKAFSLLLGTAE